MSNAKHYDTIVAPVVTEKATLLSEENKVVFEEPLTANKTEIKIAVEKVFGVKVLSVNTLNRNGKRKRSRTGYGKRRDTKRAIVTLSEESRTIDVFAVLGTLFGLAVSLGLGTSQINAGLPR